MLNADCVLMFSDMQDIIGGDKTGSVNGPSKSVIGKGGASQTSKPQIRH